MLTCKLRDEAGGRVLWDLKLIAEPQTFRIRTELDIESGAALMLGTERAGGFMALVVWSSGCAGLAPLPVMTSGRAGDCCPA